VSSIHYERELKGILSGDENVIRAATRSCSEYEKARYYRILKKPFIVVRAAGSFGVDLIAVSGDFSFPIEVKSSVKRVLRFSSHERLTEQMEFYKSMCTATGTLPIYAYRLKNYRGDAWRVFTLDIPPLTGTSAVVQRRLPVIDKSVHGNYIMRWEQGMKLSDFIDYIQTLRT